MANAIIGGMDRSKWSRICVAEVSGGARRSLEEKFQIETVSNADHPSIVEFDVILFAIKPQAFDEVMDHISHIDFSNKLLISIMAGVTIQKIQKRVKNLNNVELVRVMPNTPALIGKGITGAFVNSPDAKKVIDDLFSMCSQIFYFENESSLDVVTAISGSGPAYFFLFIESIRNAGIELGLSPEDASAMAIGTAVGASTLASVSNLDVKELREQVTSKKGTTEEALNTFKKHNFEETVKNAIFSAHRRSQALSKL